MIRYRNPAGQLAEVSQSIDGWWEAWPRVVTLKCLVYGETLEDVEEWLAGEGWVKA